jgi:shikimate kinase
MQKPVFLIGYMGSGKSTVGKKLASKLKCSFVDMDHTIEEMTGKSIANIFSDEGEDAFRQLEHSVLVSLTARKDTVISTGGGAPCFFDNMSIMNRHGLTIYLKMHPDSLAKRILDSGTKRPLLQRITPEQLPAYISRHLKEREAFYNKAHLTIKGENLKIDELYNEIIKVQ